jgi:hypothetical protein
MLHKIMEGPTHASYLFEPTKLMGTPSVIAPPMIGKISVALQFIVPGLDIAQTERDDFKKLIKNCSQSVYDSSIAIVKSKATGEEATFITIAFHIDYFGGNAECHQAIENESRILIERFLGIVSYCAGIKLMAKNIINTIVKYPKFEAILTPTTMTQSPKIKIKIPRDFFDKKCPSEEIFTALFWLRRGLAQSDPIDTYNAFMVCLQILARDWWEKNHPQPRSKMPTPTSLFKEYITTELKINADLVDRAWKKRNAIVAHGNKLNIDANDFIGLNELKFHAAKWAYTAINLALGFDLENAPRPSQNFFMTGAVRNID